MSRHTFYAYAAGKDHFFLEEVIEDQVYSFIARRSWVCRDVVVVNQCGNDDDPALGPDDLPEWNIGLTLSLPGPGEAIPGWFDDIKATALFFHECAIVNDYQYVLGIYDMDRRVSEDLFWIGKEMPDLSELQQILKVEEIE